MEGRLAGHIAIVALGPSGPTERGSEAPSGPSGSEALARRLAGEGAGVVLVTSDAELGGRLSAGIHTGTGRPPAVYCAEADLGDDDLDALVELVGELTR